MDLNAWTRAVRALYDKAVEKYRAGQRGADTYFSAEELQFLASIGLRPINLYDYAEDFVTSGEPDWDTALLMMAARRDYFLYEQHGATCGKDIHASDLPAKTAEMDGIPWLPRILAKARCFLQGCLCHDIMYCCGGDRRFLKAHGIHPADFLRAVWAARDDDAKVLEFVQKSTASR